MSINVSRLRAAGLTKELSLGTVITAAPARFINIVPPDSFTPSIEPLPSKGIQALADMYPKVTQGPATLKGMKVKFEAEPENIGEILQALFGADSESEVASFTVTLNTNDHIDFKESGGSELHAQIAAGSYPMGSSSAVNGSLCKAIKTAMDAAPSATHTYTVTYSYTTKKLTITPSAGTLQILWLTGSNQAQGAYALLGFSHTNTSDAAAQTSDSTTSVAPFQHLFTRQQVSQLPTVTWWFDKNPKYQLIGGCMLNKFDIDMKAKGLLECDTEWEGIVYDDTDGTSQSPSFSTLKPFTFAQTVVNVDGAPVVGYDNLKISVDNMVSADHVLSNSIYPKKIYSKGFDVQVSADLFFEDTVQYQKFLAGTTAHIQVVITSGQLIGGGVAYSLTLDMPVVFYKAAPIYIPSNGPLKIPFAGLVQYDPSQSPTPYTLKATLVNGVPTQY